MAATTSPLVSSDLLWEVTRGNNAYLVKRKTGGGIQFSRDPLNLMNKESRKYAGYLNSKAIGVVPTEKGGVKVISKKESVAQKPAQSSTAVDFHGGKNARKTYKAVANQTAKNGYRPDLREAAVARVSAIRKSNKEVKPEPEKKPRGAKAKKLQSS